MTSVQHYIDEFKSSNVNQNIYLDDLKKKKFDTIAVRGIYSLEQQMNKGSSCLIEPLYSSTSQVFRDSNEMEAGLSYQVPAWTYSRIHNPTMHCLEETIALLETYQCDFSASCLATSSGMSAVKQAIEPLLAINDKFPGEINFIASSLVYGGTFQLFNIRMAERGAKVRWVHQPQKLEDWDNLIDENTRFLYAEMPSNPQLSFMDIKAVSEIAHKHNIPLIIDATVATMALFRPLAHGADIVVHSLTKTVGSSGNAVGGCFTARHNMISKFLEQEQKENYAFWVKLWPFRDAGPCMSTFNAWTFLHEIKTLRLKVAHFCKNTEKVVSFLKEHPNVEEVQYLGLPEHPRHEEAKKYMKLVDTDIPMFGHLLAFNVKKDARRFFDKLEIISRATDLGRVKSVATIPAISTHLQQGEEARANANIPANLVRLCVGGEDAEDIIADLKQALEY